MSYDGRVYTVQVGGLTRELPIFQVAPGVKIAIFNMLDAKCPKCDKKAEVNDEMTEVNCPYCLTKIPYDEYIELMKEKALNMGIEFQSNWDRNPYSF